MFFARLRCWNGESLRACVRFDQRRRPGRDSTTPIGIATRDAACTVVGAWRHRRCHRAVADLCRQAVTRRFGSGCASRYRSCWIASASRIGSKRAFRTASQVACSRSVSSGQRSFRRRAASGATAPSSTAGSPTAASSAPSASNLPVRGPHDDTRWSRHRLAGPSRRLRTDRSDRPRPLGQRMEHRTPFGRIDRVGPDADARARHNRPSRTAGGQELRERHQGAFK